MEKSFEVEREMSNYLESLHYETEARKEIVTFMLNNNMDIKSEAFERYHSEYVELSVEYKTAKKELEKSYISDELREDLGGVVTWNLDFESGILSLKGRE